MLTSIFRTRRWRLISPLTVLLLGSLTLLGAGVRPSAVGMASAWAQGGPSSAVSPRRMDELAERVKILELENEALERRVRLDTEHQGQAVEDLERRVRALEGHAQASLESTVQPPETNAEPDVSCKDPYIDVGRGIRRIKPGCESTANPCDAPEVVDVRGVRTILPACRESVEKKTGGCDSPYYIDAKGLKHFKSECL